MREQGSDVGARVASLQTAIMIQRSCRFVVFRRLCRFVYHRHHRDHFGSRSGSWIELAIWWMSYWDSDGFFDYSALPGQRLQPLVHRARQELIAVQSLLAASNNVELSAAFVVYQEALAGRLIVLRF